MKHKPYAKYFVIFVVIPLVALLTVNQVTAFALYKDCEAKYESDRTVAYAHHMLLMAWVSDKFGEYYDDGKDNLKRELISYSEDVNYCCETEVSYIEKSLPDNIRNSEAFMRDIASYQAVVAEYRNGSLEAFKNSEEQYVEAKTELWFPASEEKRSECRGW